MGCGSPVVKVSDHDMPVMSSSRVPLKTHRVGQRCTLNLSRAETSSRWCGVEHVEHFLSGSLPASLASSGGREGWTRERGRDEQDGKRGTNPFSVQLLGTCRWETGVSIRCESLEWIQAQDGLLRQPTTAPPYSHAPPFGHLWQDVTEQLNKIRKATGVLQGKDDLPVGWFLINFCNHSGSVRGGMTVREI
ncbi:hypothetical protein TNCV_4855001 [Trichonephila clavipes]|nr:hypothetical protein TNCV_4855001 [Trichonephila clavipes]